MCGGGRGTKAVLFGQIDAVPSVGTSLSGYAVENKNQLFQSGGTIKSNESVNSLPQSGD